MWLRAFLVWLIVIGAEVAHGILRSLFLVPLVGDFPARQIGVLTGSLLIVVITYFCLDWVRPPRAAATLLEVGLGWTALTLAFELGFGRIALGYSWDRIASDYNIARGGFLPLGLLVMTLAPLIVARIPSLPRAARQPRRRLTSQLPGNE